MDKRTKRYLGEALTTADLELLYTDVSTVLDTLAISDCELGKFESNFTEDELKAMAHIIVTFELIASKYGVSKQLEKLIDKRYRQYLKNIVHEVMASRFNDNIEEDDDFLEEDGNYFEDTIEDGADVEDSDEIEDNSNFEDVPCGDCTGCSNSAIEGVKDFDDVDGDIIFVDDEIEDDSTNKSMHEEPVFSDEPSVYSNFPQDINGSLISEDDVNTIMGIVGGSEE